VPALQSHHAFDKLTLDVYRVNHHLRLVCSAYGAVFKGTHIASGAILAIKQCPNLVRAHHLDYFILRSHAARIARAIEAVAVGLGLTSLCRRRCVQSQGPSKESIQKEIDILKQCQHDNIVQYYGSTDKGKVLWVPALAFFFFFFLRDPRVRAHLLTTMSLPDFDGVLRRRCGERLDGLNAREDVLRTTDRCDHR
jgi:hypothetical protein